MATYSNRFLAFVLTLATLCGLSGCTYDLVVRAGYSDPNGVYSAVEGPPAAGGSDAGAPVATPDGGRKLGANANYAYAVGFGANSVPWAASYATPTITQTAPTTTSAGSGAAGQPLSVTAQAGQAATGGTNAGGLGGSLTLAPGQGGTSGGGTAGTAGSVNLNIPAPIAGAGNGLANVQYGGTTVASIGYLVGGTAQSAIYLLPGGTAPSSTNYSFREDGSGDLVANAPSGSLYFSIAGTVVGEFTPGALASAVPLGGYSNTGLSFRGQTSPNTVVGGTGGTQTISAAQSAIPFFLITTGTTSSGVIVDFSTNASTGFFMCDLSGVGNLAGGSLTLKNGTGTVVITATVLTALRAAGKTGIMVVTYGTNNITSI